MGALIDHRTSFGWLSIYDLKGCKGNISNVKILSNFLEVLVENVMGMNIVGTPQFQYFQDNDYNRERDLVGYSITCIISLSSITIHICELSKTAYIDIFSCCELDESIENQCLNLIKSIFEPDEVRGKIIRRGIK